VSSLILSEDINIAANGADTALDQPPSLANGGLYNRTVVIVEMKPDSRVGGGIAEQLRDTVSFLIEQHRDQADKRRQHDASNLAVSSKFFPQYFSRPSLTRNRRPSNGMRPALGSELEVVLFLDSPGGTVHDYGLASSHLSRLRKEPQMTLSVCVDRVAASGGYMMACQATPGHLFAAPFAMVGSIGVLMETVNVNEVLKRYGVKPLVIKAGKNKAPLKTLGEVTQEELKMAQDDADVIHEAFQQWVMQSRPDVVTSPEWIEKVCTGSVFLGKEAQKLGLVDRVLTSDEYIAERIASGDRVLRLIPYKGPQFGLKLSPFDLLLSGLDAEGRAKIRKRIQGLGTGAFQCIAPLFRVGAAVSVLNHLASLQSRQNYSWRA
jgi:serine protease SohB